MPRSGPVPVGETVGGRRRTWARVAFAAVVLAHLAVLYWPSSPSTGGLPVDKVVHALVFGVVLAAAVPASLDLRRVGIVLVLHAVVSELVQEHLLPGRSGDPGDAVADLVGVLIVTLLLRRRR